MIMLSSGNGRGPSNNRYETGWRRGGTLAFQVALAAIVLGLTAGIAAAQLADRSKSSDAGGDAPSAQPDSGKDGIIGAAEAKKALQWLRAGIAGAGKGGASARLAVPDDVDLQADVVYKKVGDESIALDIYGLKGKHYQQAPLLVFIHGGGYVGSGKQEILARLGDIFLPLLREHGYRVASLNYRLCKVKGPKLIDCSTDCKDALRFLAKNSETYGIDPQRMATLGSSAGGSLSLLQALTKDSDLPGDPQLAACSARAKCAVAWYGATDFTAPGFREQVGAARIEQRTPVLFKSKPEENLREYEDVSPVCYMQRNGLKPPILLVHGDHDLTAPIQQSAWMDQQAKKLGVPVTFITVKNAGHNFKAISGPISPSRSEINRLTTQFILDNNK